MTLSEALKPIAPVVGLTSLIAAPESVSTSKAEIPTLDVAKMKLESLYAAQNDCRSDAAYWGYAGQIAYWRAIVYILEAAAIVGDDNLPDEPPPKTDGVVMDSCYHIENYGQRILNAAKKKKEL